MVITKDVFQEYMLGIRQCEESGRLYSQMMQEINLGDESIKNAAINVIQSSNLDFLTNFSQPGFTQHHYNLHEFIADDSNVHLHESNADNENLNSTINETDTSKNITDLSFGNVIGELVNAGLDGLFSSIGLLPQEENLGGESEEESGFFNFVSNIVDNLNYTNYKFNFNITCNNQSDPIMFTNQFPNITEENNEASNNVRYNDSMMSVMSNIFRICNESISENGAPVINETIAQSPGGEALVNITESIMNDTEIPLFIKDMFVNIMNMTTNGMIFQQRRKRTFASNAVENLIKEHFPDAPKTPTLTKKEFSEMKKNVYKCEKSIPIFQEAIDKIEELRSLPDQKEDEKLATTEINLSLQGHLKNLTSFENDIYRKMLSSISRIHKSRVEYLYEKINFVRLKLRHRNLEHQLIMAKLSSPSTVVINMDEQKLISIYEEDGLTDILKIPQLSYPESIKEHYNFEKLRMARKENELEMKLYNLSEEFLKRDKTLTEIEHKAILNANS